MNARHSHEHSSAPTTQDLAGQLRSRGMRVTVQREQVLAAVRRLGHATPDEISDSITGVDVATVYRTLELFEQLGLVRHAHLGHGAPSYRPAEDQHSHVVCHACGRVVASDPALIDGLERQLRERSGFRLDRSHLTVFGTCRDCAAAEVEAEAAAAEEEAAEDGRTHVDGSIAIPGVAEQTPAATR